jgi:2-polyprenyl-3-methyl-5-hydroxy-6-metoxy-1,4-benzoquinol methylase
MNHERQRLTEFWNNRYNEFSLQESGIKGLSDDYIYYYYRCKSLAIKSALKKSDKTIETMKILDIGCGQGFFYDWYKSQNVKEYLGIDISKKSIENLKSIHGENNFVCEDFCDDDFGIMQEFDVIQSIEVIHLIKNDDYLLKGLNNLVKNMTKNSILILTDVLPQKKQNPLDYIVFRDKEFYEKFCESNNLKITGIFPIYYWIPSRGVRKFPFNLIFDKIPAKIIYLFDRLFIKLKFPQVLQTHDSKMKIIIIKKNESI